MSHLSSGRDAATATEEGLALLGRLLVPPTLGCHPQEFQLVKMLAK